MRDTIEVEFRSATPKDADAVVGMMQALENDDPNEKPFHEGRRRLAYKQVMEDSRLGRIWLIAVGEEVIGYAVFAYAFSFEYGGRSAFVDELYVVPDYRGKGVGRKAVAFMEGFARSEELATLHLEVSRGSAGALHLYRDSGFRNHDRFLLTKWLDSINRR